MCDVWRPGLTDQLQTVSAVQVQERKMIRKEKTSNSFPRKPPLVSSLPPESVLQTVPFHNVSFFSQSPESYHVTFLQRFVYSAQMWGPYLKILPWSAWGFIICWLYLTPSRFMLSFFLNTAWLSLHPHSSLCCPTSLLPSSLSLTSAASVPSRLILLSRVYVHCPWLVCHRHVVTARLPSPQSVLWSAACNQLSLWYFNLSPIFVSFFILFADLFISNSSVCVLDERVNAARNQPQSLCKLIIVLEVKWNWIHL